MTLLINLQLNLDSFFWCFSKRKLMKRKTRSSSLLSLKRVLKGYWKSLKSLLLHWWIWMKSHHVRIWIQLEVLLLILCRNNKHFEEKFLSNQTMKFKALKILAEGRVASRSKIYLLILMIKPQSNVTLPLLILRN